MVSFKQMWDDVGDMLKEDKIENVTIVELYKDGFIIREDEMDCFINKQDFVDFWCNILYFNEIPKENLLNHESKKFKHVYNVVKNLPYVKESCGVIKVEE